MACPCGALRTVSGNGIGSFPMMLNDVKQDDLLLLERIFFSIRELKRADFAFEVYYLCGSLDFMISII